MKKRKSFVGGVVNKTLGKDNFDSIVKMLKQDGCEISHISFSSLKGFIFKIHVKNQQEQDIEFYGLNETTQIFDTPVDTLVVKMAILYTGAQRDERALALPEYQKKPKEMEYFADFEKEAIVQSQIYEKTLSKGQPICPALVDFSHFTSLDSSMPFLNMVEEKCTTDNEAKEMISYIKSILSSVHDCQLGVITMESAATFETFYDVYDSYENVDPTTLALYDNSLPPTQLQVQLCKKVIIQIIRLLNECRIVHCDLHGENVLVKKSHDSSVDKIFIIDFGRILHIDKLTKREKEVAQQYAIDFFYTRSFFTFSRPELELSPVIKRDITKFDKNYVKTLIQFIISIDFMYNKTVFDRVAQSKIQKNYIEKLDGVTKLHKLTAFAEITDELNRYYATNIICNIEETAKYKTVKPEEKHDKDVTRFETLCDRMEVMKGSPSKYQFVARQAPELLRIKRSIRNRSMKIGKLFASSNSKSRSAYKSVSGKSSLRSARRTTSVNSSDRSLSSAQSSNSFGKIATNFDFNLSDTK